MKNRGHHPMDRTANWHSHGGWWFTLVRGAREGVNTAGVLVHTRKCHHWWTWERSIFITYKAHHPSVHHPLKTTVMNQPQLKVLPSVHHPLKTLFMTNLWMNHNWRFYTKCTIHWKPYLWLAYGWTTTEGFFLQCTIHWKPHLWLKLLVNANWIFPMLPQVPLAHSFSQN